DAVQAGSARAAHDRDRAAVSAQRARARNVGDRHGAALVAAREDRRTAPRAVPCIEVPRARGGPALVERARGRGRARPPRRGADPRLTNVRENPYCESPTSPMAADGPGETLQPCPPNEFSSPRTSVRSTAPAETRSSRSTAST